MPILVASINESGHHTKSIEEPLRLNALVGAGRFSFFENQVGHGVRNPFAEVFKVFVVRFVQAVFRVGIAIYNGEGLFIYEYGH